MKKLRSILHVETSALGRTVFGELIEDKGGVVLLGSAQTRERCLSLIKKGKPDVVIIGHVEKKVETSLRREPELSGTLFLVAPALGGPPTRDTFHAQALEVLATIKRGGAIGELNGLGERIAKHRFESMNSMPALTTRGARPSEPRRLAKAKNLDEVLPSKQNTHAVRVQCPLIVIGSSTGGPKVLRDLLCSLPGELPPIVIAQHMPPDRLFAFAQRLNSECALEVVSIDEEEIQLRRGRVIFAPGDRHVVIQPRGLGLVAAPLSGERVNGHYPSADVLFRSLANLGCKGAFGVVLTGMGNDGAQGLLELRQGGAATWVQNEASCVVYGMPKAAWDLGAASRQGDPEELVRMILAYENRGKKHRRAG